MAELARTGTDASRRAAAQRVRALADDHVSKYPGVAPRLRTVRDERARAESFVAARHKKTRELLNL